MNKVTEPTVSADDAALEADLLAQGQAHDARPVVENPAESDLQPQSDERNTPPEKGEAAKKTEVQKPDTKPEAGDKTGEQKTETPYQAKRSDKERLADSWKKLDEEKAAERKKLEEERAAFQREREAFQRDREAATRQPPRPKRETPLSKYSERELRDAARDMERKGKYEDADAIRDELEAREREAREQPSEDQPPARGGLSQQEMQQIQTEWVANLQQLEKENPELADKTGDFRKHVAQAIAERPELSRFGAGIKYVVEGVKLAREAAKVPALQTQIADLQKKNAELLGKLNPAGGNPERITSGPKRIEDLSDAEAESELLRRASEADGV